MDKGALKEALRRKAASLGVPRLAVTHAEPFYEEEAHLRRLEEKGQRIPFAEPDPRRRTHPAELLPGAKSLIVAALPYWNGPDPRRPAGLRGRISRYAFGEDYHRVLHRILEELIRFLQTESGEEARYLPMVDTGEIIDRAAARRAGLGWMGKNTNIIHPELGSWFFLGAILTTLELPADDPAEVGGVDPAGCGDCTLCLDACPTGALEEPYHLNPDRCIGYLNQKPGFIPRELREKVGDHLWGCDICQQVCPKNRAPLAAARPEFRVDAGFAYPELRPLLKMSKKEFQRRYGHTAVAWRGKKTLQRNALVAIGARRGREALLEVIEALDDVRPVIRGHAAWALGRIGGEVAAAALEKRRRVEEDPGVLEEIRAALEELDGNDD